VVGGEGKGEDFLRVLLFGNRSPGKGNGVPVVTAVGLQRASRTKENDFRCAWNSK